ncbi:hypothetical protein E4695_08655 [Alcaligenaceae bacterium 429]|nr:hypothetical protein E4695_08655 [Alcaligenaceae bacterium 429]
MTQIQAYEDMSKEALIEHHLHTLQQHADDMDMLAKELAGKGMRPYSLNLDPLGIRALTSDAITGAFEFGRLNTYRPKEGHWLEPFWKMGNAASPAVHTVPTETLRVCGVIADKIESGALSHVGFYSNTALSEFIRQLMRAVSISPALSVGFFEKCSCPSGNGSLRPWPCPVHPPESEQEVQP